MSTKLKKKRARNHGPARPPKKASMKAPAPPPRIDAEFEPEMPPVKPWSPRVVDLTVNPGPGLLIDISASYEAAHEALRWVHRVMPELLVPTPESASSWDMRDDLNPVSIDIKATSLHVTIRANQDIVFRFLACLPSLLTMGETLPSPSSAASGPTSGEAPEPDPVRDPVREYRGQCPIGCPQWVRTGKCCHAAPPQGVRFEDDPQGNPRIVKNEPTT